MKWLMEPVAVAFAVVVVVAMIILLGGVYLRTTQPEPVPTPAPADTGVTEIPTPVETTLAETIPPTPEPTIEIPSLPPTKDMSRAWVQPATPFHDKKYYLLPYHQTVYDPRATGLPPVIFQQSYNLDFQDEAVVVNVPRPPLILDYALTRFISPTRTFVYITIRDNQTQQLLSQEGFYGPYSTNSPKRLFFSSPGTYHINMYGGFSGIGLTIR